MKRESGRTLQIDVWVVNRWEWWIGGSVDNGWRWTKTNLFDICTNIGYFWRVFRNRGDSCVNVQMYFSSFSSYFFLNFFRFVGRLDLSLLNANVDCFSLVSGLAFVLRYLHWQLLYREKRLRRSIWKVFECATKTNKKRNTMITRMWFNLWGKQVRFGMRERAQN